MITAREARKLRRDQKKARAVELKAREAAQLAQDADRGRELAPVVIRTLEEISALIRETATKGDRISFFTFPRDTPDSRILHDQVVPQLVRAGFHVSSHTYLPSRVQGTSQRSDRTERGDCTWDWQISITWPRRWYQRR